MNTKALNKSPLFAALTRAPMVMGVTQTFFVFNLAFCMILFLVSKNLVLTVGLWGLLHGVGVLGCEQDECFFEIWLKKLSLTCPNRFYWGCNSYDPR